MPNLISLAARLFSIVTGLTVVFVLSLDPTQSYAQLPWPDKNGPTFDGRALEEEARGLPTTWDEKSGQNVAWKIPVEGQGHSSPVVGEGRVWVTSATVDGKKQLVYVINAATGDVLHHKVVFENANPEPLGNEINTYASPSPVLEPGAAYVHFGSYGTARLDAETGDIVWQNRSLPARHFRGPGSSPVLFEDLLILTFDGIDQQYLAALNKETGELVWRTDRSTDYQDLGPDGKPRGDGDYRKAFSTPGLVKVAGRTQVVSVGARAAFGYDARTGEEIWTVLHDDYNAAPRPVFYDNLAILSTGSRGSAMMAVRLGETTRGNVTDTHVVWERSQGVPRLTSPALVGERLYSLYDNGVLYCLNAATGEEMQHVRLGGNYTAAPVIANGLIYCCNEGGRTSVVSIEEGKIVAQNTLEEGQRATPAIAGGALYLRTYGHLYKIAAAP
jgi:outer membrane protein assembly factor BamB